MIRAFALYRRSSAAAATVRGGPGRRIRGTHLSAAFSSLGWSQPRRSHFGWLGRAGALRRSQLSPLGCRSHPVYGGTPGGTGAIRGFLWLPLGPSFAGPGPADRPESRWPGHFRACDRRGPGPTLATGRASSVATAEGAFHRRHIICSCDKQKLRTRLRVRQLENSPAQIICLQIPLSGKFNLCSLGHGGKVRRRSVVTVEISGRWQHRELGPGR